MPLVPPEPLAGRGLTPAQAPSEVQAAAMQRRNNTVERMENPRCPWIPAAPESDPIEVSRASVNGRQGKPTTRNRVPSTDGYFVVSLT